MHMWDFKIYLQVSGHLLEQYFFFPPEDKLLLFFLTSKLFSTNDNRILHKHVLN